MIDNILISFGGVIFSILLILTYYIKTRSISIKNRIFEHLLIVTLILGIFEILTFVLLNYSPDASIFILISSRIYSVSVLTWIMILCVYVFTLGDGYKISSFGEILKERFEIRVVALSYFILLIISFFFKFNFGVYNGVSYISGPLLYYAYVVGLIFVIVVLLMNIKNEELKPRYVILCGLLAFGSMILHYMFPYVLICLMTVIVELYFLYFWFENPDIYLVKELESAKARADESNRSKTKFLSNMSYEIIKPINSIVSCSDSVIGSTPFNEKLAFENIKKIYTYGIDLLEIINNILDISKIDEIDDLLENREYNFSDIIMELRSIVEARISKDNIKFIINVDHNIPSKLLGDKAKIFQILLNILSNSVKYTEVGRITLAVTSKMNNNNVLLNFKISDTGCGMSDEYISYLNGLINDDKINKEKLLKSGVGLIITSKLVKALGGKIWFKSKEDAGTTFYVQISQAVIDAHSIGNIFDEKNIVEEYLDCSKYKILLVDDNKLNLLVAQKVLAPYKFQIKTFNNGLDCVNDIKEGSSYDMIFLDHMMPKMDGIEVVHILHKLDGYTIPPVVALTANAITGTREMYFREGFDEYLAKPINIRELDLLVHKYFDKNIKQDEDTVSNDMNTSDDINLNSLEYLTKNGFNINQALTCVSDQSAFNEVLEFFYDDIDKQLGELEKAIDCDDILRYATLIHGLYSDCRSLGMDEFADLLYIHELKSKANDVNYIYSKYNELISMKDKYKNIIKEYLGR